MGLATINTAGRNNSCSGVRVGGGQCAGGGEKAGGGGMIITLGKLNYMPLKMSENEIIIYTDKTIITFTNWRLYENHFESVDCRGPPRLASGVSQCRCDVGGGLLQCAGWWSGASLS